TTGVSHTARPSGYSCSDGNACNGAETCNGTTNADACRPGTPIVPQNDNNEVPVDTGDSATGGTIHTNEPLGKHCGSATATTFCDGQGACVLPPTPPPAETELPAPPLGSGSTSFGDSVNF